MSVAAATIEAMTTLEWGADVENELVDETPVADLRDWARGLYALEAATELLIRGRWAQTWRPWVLKRDGGGWWIDFEDLPNHIHELSGGEYRFLRFAASISGEYPSGPPLSEVSGLDRRNVDLVLAAIAHAAGTHEQSGIEYDKETGRPLGIVHYDESLHPWPDPQ